MASTGLTLGTVTSQTVGVWTNPNNILIQDDTVATFTTTTKNDVRTLEVQTFGFDSSVPVGATINQVDLRVRGSCSSGGSYIAWLRVGTTDGTTHSRSDTTLTTTDYLSEVDPNGGAGWTRADLLNGTFVVRVQGLQPNNTTSRAYNFAYVEVTVTYTTATAPTVTTQAVSSIGVTTATGNGTVTSDGGATVTERGVCWALTLNPTTSDSKATSAGTTGAYTVSMTSMAANTGYHARAYAINSVGTSYGSDVTFTTLNYPQLTGVSSITGLSTIQF